LLTDTVGDIERALAVLARRANSPRVEERLRGETGIRLERAAYSVLGAIGDQDGIRLKELSRSLGLDISTVSRHAHHLIEAGLVSRHPIPAMAAQLWSG
jgi:DNA-binding MarR family transcriptional regulator